MLYKQDSYRQFYPLMGPLLGLSAPPCYATPPRKDATDTTRGDTLGTDDMDDIDDTEHYDD